MYVAAILALLHVAMRIRRRRVVCGCAVKYIDGVLFTGKLSCDVHSSPAIGGWNLIHLIDMSCHSSH